MKVSRSLESKEDLHNLPPSRMSLFKISSQRKERSKLKEANEGVNRLKEIEHNENSVKARVIKPKDRSVAITDKTFGNIGLEVIMTKKEYNMLPADESLSDRNMDLDFTPSNDA